MQGAGHWAEGERVSVAGVVAHGIRETSGFQPPPPAGSRARVDLPAFPRRVTIELSSRCNLSCVMCPRQYLSGEAGLMDDDLFQRIVQEISQEEVEAVVPFFRGEPLLHPRFVELLGLVRARCGARIQLATNGLLLTEGTTHELLHRVKVDFISFSLDALTEETYGKIRLGGSLERARENVLRFLRMREESGSSGTVVQVSLTESPFNLEEISGFIGYWRRLADRVRVYPLHSEGGKFGALASPGFLRDPSERSCCMKPFRDLVIYHDGRVALCNHDWDRPEGASLGSVREKSIREIWQGGPYRRVRGMQHRGEWEGLVPCRHCDHWQGEGTGDATIGLLVGRQ